MAFPYFQQKNTNKQRKTKKKTIKTTKEHSTKPKIRNKENKAFEIDTKRTEGIQKKIKSKTMLPAPPPPPWANPRAK